MAVYNYDASNSTHIDQNLTDFEGSTDANGFSLYVPTNLVYNPTANTTTVTYSYMLHERTNNFSTYSCTTWTQYKTNGAASYTRQYNPATTIQYVAMTTNRYYWMGNNDASPPIAFTSIPTTGSYTSPTASAWSFTVNHNASGVAPATTIQAYMDSNTNASYVPVGTTITATLTTILNSASTNLNLVSPYFVTNPQISTSSVSRPTPSTIRVKLSTAAATNTAANNTITYVYKLYIDGSLVSTSAAQSEGTLYQFPDISVTPNASHDVYVTATDNTGTAGTSGQSSTITSNGIPSVGTVSATEQSAQSRSVDLVWSAPSANGSTVTSQTVAWSTSPTFATTLGSATFANSTTTTYTIPHDHATAALGPSTIYYWMVSATNGVGTNTSSISSFTTRASSPFISPSAGATPSTRSSTKVWNGSSMVQAQVMVYDGTTPYNSNGWKYLK